VFMIVKFYGRRGRWCLGNNRVTRQEIMVKLDTGADHFAMLAGSPRRRQESAAAGLAEDA